MSWIELDDGILDHPKFIRAVKLGGSEAVHLWLGIRAYCAKLLTDGKVPSDMLDEVRGPKDSRRRAAALDALVTVGLLETTADGVQMHDYLQWSKSRDVVLKQRESARERQAKSRGSHSVTGSVTHGAVTPSVTEPSPLLSTPTLTSITPVAPKGGEPKKRERRSGTWRRVPKDWEIRPEERAWGEDHHLDVDLELAKLRDWEFKDPRTDADAVCRTWLRTAWERKGSPAPKSAGPAARPVLLWDTEAGRPA